ncbi:MAG: transporter substrate-binding domain-containing protein [Lachnospiraceae bacterium]|nr:transporter substrate-binding domain-containing protein [Lachnospiraceae bacterium]
MKKFLALCLVTLMVLGLSACGSKQGSSDKKTLSMATSAEFPPYEFVDDSGNYAGIDVEIAGKIAEKLGVELKVENIEFGGIIAAVSSGKYDIGMSGFTITEERKQNVNFSVPYATAVQVVIVKEDSPIKTVDDLYATGASYKIGTQLSTTGAIYVEGDITDKKMSCTMQEYKAGADAVAALVSGKIDCVVIDNEPAKKFVAANPGLKILDTEYATEQYAIAISKNNTELLEKVNKALEELIADGTVKAIVDIHIAAN